MARLIQRVPNSVRYVWFDFFRGTAALIVCASHLRAVLFLDYLDLVNPNIIVKAFYFLTGIGHEAVMIFFVLSGFFVGGIVLKAGNSFSLSSYAWERLTRLWVVLVPALIITAILDCYFRAFLPELTEGRYFPIWNSGPSSQNVYSASIITFIANLLFLQTIVAPVFGTNGPLWSLSNEFWYYVLFPILVALIDRNSDGKPRAMSTKTVLLVIFVGLVSLLPLAMVIGFIVWLMGVVVYLSVGRISPKPAFLTSLIGVVLLAFALVISKTMGSKMLWFPHATDILVAAAFSVLAVGIVNLPSSRHSPTFSRISGIVSQFSYSLYLIHFPLVLLIGSTFYRSGKVQPSFTSGLVFLVWLIGLVGVGYIFWVAFEYRTGSVRRWILTNFNSRSL